MTSVFPNQIARETLGRNVGDQQINETGDPLKYRPYLGPDLNT